MCEDNRMWNMYNEQLGRRGKVLTLFLDKKNTNFKSELRRMNNNKRGAKYVYPNSLIQMGFCLKCVFHYGYRQIQQFMEDVAPLLNFSIPDFRTLWWRIDNLEKQELRFDIPKSEKIEIAVDSTGLKLANDGEYRTTKYGKRKVWIKMHAAVNKDTNEAVNIIITKDDVGDSKKFKPLLEPLKGFILSVRADKGYDTSKDFEYCKKNNIQPIIPVRINACPSGKGDRQNATRTQFDIPPTHTRLCTFDRPARRMEKQKTWKKRVGYGFRWVVEGFYSRYKRIFGEYVFSVKWENIVKEIITKVNILNLFAVLR